MTTFVPGQTIWIRCEVGRGAFPTESLVTFQTVEGLVSGFVRTESVKRSDDREGYLQAIVKEVSDDTIAVVAK